MTGVIFKEYREYQGDKMLIKYAYKEDEDYGMEDTMQVYNKDGNFVSSEFVHSLCECPEDAIIGRDLISCQDIIRYMKLAYEAGKNGEELVIEEQEWND